MNALDVEDERSLDDSYLSQSLSLADLGAALKRSSVFVLAAVVVCILLASFYLMVTPPRYSTDMILAAEQTTERQNIPQSAGAVGALGGAAANLLGITGNSLSPDLEKFRVLFVSTQTAGIVDGQFHLLQKYYPGWQPGSHTWVMPPWSLGNVIPRLAKLIFGRPIWRAPTSGDLATILTDRITIQKGDTDPFLTVSTLSDDPKFSEQLLLALTTAANEILRQRAQEQALVEADYLSKQLETVSNALHRQVLIELLSAQEQTLMLSSSKLPYAAQILTPPTTHFDQPKPGITLTLAIGALVGLAIGIFIAFFREAIGRSRQQIPTDSHVVLWNWVRRREGIG